MNWHRVEVALPDEEVIVRTISPGGIETMLKRRGLLWFVPDGSMYVYYTPVFWSPLEVNK